MNKKEEQTNARPLFCLNPACSARGKQGEGNIVRYGSKRPRYRCKTCGKTFEEKTGTMYEGLRKPEELITLVVKLLSNGCPVQAIVRTFELDERTVARWLERAGKHCEQVHSELIVQKQLDLQHVQVDEIYVKCYQKVAWMAMAIMVPTRLWLGGVVSRTRDHKLTDRLLRLVRGCCLSLAALLICCDGFAAYPGSIYRAFREKVPNPYGIGRTRLEAWPEILIGIVNKHRQEKRVVQVTREMLQGLLEQAVAILKATAGGMVLNTAFIERFNATLRERLATLTRRCRHASHRLEMVQAGMWLVGTTYNWCLPHRELSRREAKREDKPGEILLTPAMASGLTDHIWSLSELLGYRRTPAALPPPKRGRGRPRKQAPSDPSGASARKPKVSMDRKEAPIASTI
jgi:transposase-like protein